MRMLAGGLRCWRHSSHADSASPRSPFGSRRVIGFSRPLEAFVPLHAHLLRPPHGGWSISWCVHILLQTLKPNPMLSSDYQEAAPCTSHVPSLPCARASVSDELLQVSSTCPLRRRWANVQSLHNDCGGATVFWSLVFQDGEVSVGAEASLGNLRQMRAHVDESSLLECIA